ncbi:hypothetical protein [Breoghania sp.]|uniref:hypothetical protein n=1 Tax=Breoghania sp. TaxID=2065378 RepID=UPI00260395D5|nr:hypothetical protein [Breoghania sp.]MDJ0931811.1 hypothetical protein [Breoghania sp.]
MGFVDTVRRKWAENPDRLLAWMVVFVFFVSVAQLEFRPFFLGTSVGSAFSGYLLTGVNCLQA